MARSVETASSVTRQGSPVAHIVRQDGQAWSLHFTSEDATFSGIGWEYAKIARQGRKPLVRRDVQQVRVLTFTHVVAAMTTNDDWLLAQDSGWTPTVAVWALMEIVDVGEPVRLVNVTADIETRGWWLPALAVKIVERDTNQQIKRAELTWTLTEWVDDRPAIARTPPPPPPPPPPSVANQPPPMQADYTIVQGDSLWAIASRFLGDGTRWTELYDLNKGRLSMEPPVQYQGMTTVWIYPGDILQIPPR